MILDGVSLAVIVRGDNCDGAKPVVLVPL